MRLEFHKQVMGSRARVLYGAAEFSRDIDFAIHRDSRRLSSLIDTAQRRW
jgi:hypothetical protein